MIEQIWTRIIENEGEIFKQMKGKEFTYQIIGNGLKLSTTNHIINRSVFEKAIELLPIENTVPLQHLRAPSYLYAILTDKRIIE